ncbi:hypothetical protein JOB18_004554 [Solea senegalensis]|uniref:Uncharacterized protein n=1 Tax=Solea senegalensis TaxID=28829 RepID=A0AAV6SCV5_SOLSE|nr:hypothetical protein JOB18_004554 [Solea senegalensis]
MNKKEGSILCDVVVTSSAGAREQEHPAHAASSSTLRLKHGLPTIAIGPGNCSRTGLWAPLRLAPSWTPWHCVHC